jgi:SLOG family YspA-like protein
VKVITCGSAEWEDEAPIREFLIKVRDRFEHLTIIRRTDKGADALMGRAAADLGIPELVTLEQWQSVADMLGQTPIMEDRQRPIWVVVFHDDLPGSAYSREVVELALATPHVFKIWHYSHAQHWVKLKGPKWSIRSLDEPMDITMRGLPWVVGDTGKEREHDAGVRGHNHALFSVAISDVHARAGHCLPGWCVAALMVLLMASFLIDNLIGDLPFI